MRVKFLLFTLVLVISKVTIYSQTPKELLSGKYDKELNQWENGPKYSNEWKECKSSIQEIEDSLKSALKRAEKEMQKEALKYYIQIQELVINELPEDIYLKIKEGDRALALKVNEVVELEDLYDWDRTYAACKEKIRRNEKWALEKSEAAQQFPEAFRTGELDSKLYAEKVENAFGVPTSESEYGPYDKYLNEIGTPEEKAIQMAMSSRKQLYEKIKPLYSEGVHQETVVTEKSKITRTVISGGDEFKVFEIKESVPEFKFYAIDGHFEDKEFFKLELAKYKK